MHDIIRRDEYLKRLIDRRGNGLIKVITGIRRCGKSFLLFRLFIAEHNVHILFFFTTLSLLTNTD